MARALFQIGRGATTSSLANGELYYNTTNQALEVGSNISTIITTAKLNESNTGSFKVSGDISASGNLFISGNARIVGNLTFGDSDALDTVTVVANFGSDLIPSQSNQYNLGSTSKYWKNGYITSLTGSLSGSVNGIDITPFSTSVDSRLDNLEIAATSDDARLDNLEQHSGSVNAFTASITASFNITSHSLNLVSASLLNVSSSYIATSQSLNLVSASLLTFSSSQYKSDSASFDSRLDSVEAYTSSLKAAFEVSGSGIGSLTTIYGNLKVEGTQSIINSENLAIKDNLIYLNDSSSITNPDLGIVGNYNDGTYAHTGIYRESVGGKWRVFKGLTDEPSGSINSGHPSFQLADFEANEVSASINGIGRVGVYSTSVDSRLVSLETTGSNFDNRLDSIEIYTASVSTSVGLLQTTASYLNTTFSTSVDSRLVLVEATASYLNNAFSISVDSRIDNLETFSSSQYLNDSASFTTRISASTLTFNDTTNQTGIDFTHTGTQVIAIASGLSETSNVHFLNITASNNISASNTIYCQTLVAETLVGATLPVLEYETNGTLGNILIKGATSKSIQVVDTIAFEGLSQHGIDQYSATALVMTGSITASNGFSGSSISVGNVIANDITASGNLFVSGTIYTYELHSVIQSSSVIFSSGSNQIGDQQSDVLTITGSLYQTGSTSFSELTGSLFDFSASINSRIGSVLPNGIISSSAQVNIYELENYANYNDAVIFDITVVSASAWGAFQSASAYSSSFASRLVSDDFKSTTYATTGSNIFKADQIISGSVYVTGDVVAYTTSDERLKDNIQLISNPIEKVNQLRGVEFDWKDGMPKAGTHDYGVIAQDVIKVMPELVNQRPDGYFAVDYDKIIGLLIEVVKNQEIRIKNLENKLDS